MSIFVTVESLTVEGKKHISEDTQPQLARIEYKSVDGQYEYGEIGISVKGQTLEEARRHFDEILEKKM